MKPINKGATNIEVLSEKLGYSLTVEDKEVEVGPFFISNGERVVIENQLEQTDYDHLGKVIQQFIG